MKRDAFQVQTLSYNLEVLQKYGIYLLGVIAI